MRSKRLKEETLAEKLKEHVELLDSTAALEQVTATGAGVQGARQHIFLSPLNVSVSTLPEIHHPLFVMKLNAAAMQ